MTKQQQTTRDAAIVRKIATDTPTWTAPARAVPNEVRDVLEFWAEYAAARMGGDRI